MAEAASILDVLDGEDGEDGEKQLTQAERISVVGKCCNMIRSLNKANLKT